MKTDNSRFMGLTNTIAMQFFNASFYSDDTGLAQVALLEEYMRAGSPVDVDAWLKKRLSEIFLSLNAPPKWIEMPPTWAFYEGRPMVFIGEMPVAKNPVSEEWLAVETVLYVFGIRVPADEDGWEMRYKVVEQHQSLAGINRHW